jgi:hypothetical protein
VTGNFIGLDTEGLTARTNANAGIVLTSAFGNRVGGVNPEGRNLIAFNRASGVYVASGTDNAIRGNSVFANAGLGIDLGNVGVAFNDPGDNDSGANTMQNHPVLTGATNAGGVTMVTSLLNSRAVTSYTIDFYSSASCDGSGNGEGQSCLGATTVMTDGGGKASFSTAFAGIPAGWVMTATTTDAAGNTSEFSACRAIVATDPPATFTVVNTNDSGSGSLREAILQANARLSTGRDNMVFAIDGAGLRAITPSSPLPVITDSLNLDGYTQPGSSVNTSSNGNNAVILIRLDGVSAGPGAVGLHFTSSGNPVRGLAIGRFSRDGMEFDGGGLTIVTTADEVSSAAAGTGLIDSGTQDFMEATGLDLDADGKRGDFGDRRLRMRSHGPLADPQRWMCPGQTNMCSTN